LNDESNSLSNLSRSVISSPSVSLASRWLIETDVLAFLDFSPTSPLPKKEERNFVGTLRERETGRELFLRVSLKLLPQPLSSLAESGLRPPQTVRYVRIVDSQIEGGSYFFV
jgi:hypothetical protein